MEMLASAKVASKLERAHHFDVQTKLEHNYLFACEWKKGVYSPWKMSLHYSHPCSSHDCNQFPPLEKKIPHTNKINYFANRTASTKKKRFYFPCVCFSSYTITLTPCGLAPVLLAFISPWSAVVFFKPYTFICALTTLMRASINLKQRIYSTHLRNEKVKVRQPHKKRVELDAWCFIYAWMWLQLLFHLQSVCSKAMA